jgi:hypothetical protein
MKYLFFVISLLLTSQLYAQNPLGEYLGDESAFYAETKQVNQFFRRFNNEEDKDGVKYNPNDKRYRSLKDRKNYLQILFDAQNASITPDLKEEFIATVNNSDNPIFLNFRNGDWFSEVTTRFEYKGQEETAYLYLRLEPDRKGYKWVLHHVHYDRYANLLPAKESEEKKFIHPMSHELDFMNLNKAFQDIQNLQDYAHQGYKPDYLTLLLYDIKRGDVKFKTVADVKFHFFQVDEWYFEISEFNRKGMNRGWLISSLAKVPETQKETFRKYLFRE